MSDAAGVTAISEAVEVQPPRAAASAMARYRSRARRRALVITGLWALAVGAFIISLQVGPMGLSAGEVIRAYVDPDAPARLRTIVLDLRTPPALLALLVGAALALAGAQMQTILDNPLAEPFTLGVSAAAACGAAIAILSGVTLPVLPSATLPVAAAALALAASGVIALAARSPRAGGRETMVLLGIAMVFGFQALLAFLQYRASTESLQQIVFWSLGSLTRARWETVIAMAIVLAVIAPLFWMSGWKLTALRLGEARAAAMGINVPRLRMHTLIGVSILAAIAVSCVGVIGFVGLVGPHVARILVGEDQRFLLPASTAVGAALLTGAHAVSQVIIPGVVMPVGILTSLVGVPVFIMIVLSRGRLRAGASR